MMNLHLLPEERTTEAYDTDDQMTIKTNDQGERWC
jgi:hypothetical protein